MDKFLVKHFKPDSQYTYVEADNPLMAAQKLTGRKVKDRPPGDVLALVQMVVRNVVTTAPFYADGATEAPEVAMAPVATKSTSEVVVNWCVEERARLLDEVKDIETGGMIVQRATKRGLVDVTASYLDEKRARLSRLDEAIGAFDGSPADSAR